MSRFCVVFRSFNHRLALKERFDRWMPLATSYDNAENDAPIKIHADANIYAAIISAGRQLEFEVGGDRQAYLVLFEGTATVNGIRMNTRDAMEIVQENITVTADSEGEAHLLVIEMAFDEECYKEKYGENDEQYTGE